MAPELNTCEETINPAFDSNRALFRRVFFITPVKNKYVSVAYYPNKIYQPSVEIRGADKSPLFFEEEHVRSIAEHLPRICDALCRDEYYICKSQDGRFRMNTTGNYRVARIYIDKKWMAFKLEELRYLSYIFSWFTINSSDTQKH
jgi:hypothetical protein